mmetsp:Transcript_7333/g.11145  ORF Transcript_7333/g.11145 Transcript_7333/m.11145 type:complete len:139 (-) Transcript_7333:547-963(-)
MQQDWESHIQQNWQRDSSELSSQLDASILNKKSGEFDLDEYTSHLKKIRKRIREQRESAHSLQFQSISRGLEPVLKRKLERAGQTGHWLTVYPNQLNGTDLTACGFNTAATRSTFPPHAKGATPNSPCNMPSHARREA